MADFVDKIVKDPKNPPATVILSGYLGASSEADHTRLYFDPSLSSYVDIPNADILHQQYAKSDDGLQASHVWIARSAQLIHGAPAPDKPKGTFLDGAIMRDHIAAAAGGGAGGGQAAWPLTMDPFQCPHTFVVCHHTQFSPTATAIPTHVICDLRTLTPACHHTLGIVCLPRTVADPGCLASANIACPSIGACPSIACGDPGQQAGTPQVAAAAFPPIQTPTLTPGGFVCPSFNCGGGHTLKEQAAIPTVLVGGLCPSFGCHPPGHHTMMAQMAIPTVLVGGICPSFGCHPPVHHTMMQQMAIPTLLAGGLCPTFAVHCGGGGGQHTMMQFMPNNPGYSTWYMCPPR
ncbi:hypothetical protein UP10_15165 [Bradyrhizobium sp. LTSPM299]|uniref:hypothetical protein n=1 Tax=Bradyrhizobium sp. LTSPM299 TaxID=1619233 RepID=UPI0005C806A3|nr:hypothetical protein [Bradyrhizobium sp. LTSPM299]KJC60014.1 hypothetical protein UP10_15165 [Bradyrhizobium sp. LTSPM299]